MQMVEIKFSPVEYTNKAGEKSLPLNTRRVKKVPLHSVTEVKGADATVTYDTMKAEVL